MKPVVLISGAMAAGKSTVAEILARRTQLGVHLRGDAFRRMIVSGRVEMGDGAGDAALSQLELRYRIAIDAALHYREAGYGVVHQDVVLGEFWPWMIERYAARGPVAAFMLAPAVQAIEEREAARSKVGYGGFSIESLNAVVETTPRSGIWIDSTALTAEATADAIQHHLPDNWSQSER